MYQHQNKEKMSKRWFEYVWVVFWPWTCSGQLIKTDANQCSCQVHSHSEALLCIQLLRRNLTAVKELAYILATKDQYQKFGYRDTRYWRLSRQDAERMLQTLEKGLNGELIFEFKENVDKEEKEEQLEIVQALGAGLSETWIWYWKDTWWRRRHLGCKATPKSITISTNARW